jgi:ABC-2 type transport system ATP-binding protein
MTDQVTATPVQPPDALGRGERSDLLALHEIHKSWGDHRVLDGVELVLEAGTVTWVGGSNGAGKTTLMRIASGLIRPESGVVDLLGLHPERNRREYLRRIGFLSAGDRGLYARLSPRRHLEFCARMALIPRKERAGAVTLAMSQFNIEELADRPAQRLSMGQRQRVRLAMTFIHQPMLVLLDEPVNSLDVDGIEVLVRYIDGVKARGGAVMWVSPIGIANPIGFDAEFHLHDGNLEQL